MDNELKQNLTASETWVRGLYILLFAFLLVVARLVTGTVVVIQFLFTVFSGQTNENLQVLGASLARFIYQSLLFLTYNSDSKPFPFSEWPVIETSIQTTEAEPTKPVKPKTKPKAKAKTKSKPRTKAKAKTETKAETEVEVETETEPKTEPKAEPKAEPADSSSETPVNTDTKPED